MQRVLEVAIAETRRMELQQCMCTATNHPERHVSNGWGAGACSGCKLALVKDDDEPLRETTLGVHV
jgi:hypothetical protein